MNLVIPDEPYCNKCPFAATNWEGSITACMLFNQPLRPHWTLHHKIVPCDSCRDVRHRSGNE